MKRISWTYLGNDYTINWFFVCLVSLVIAVSLLPSNSGAIFGRPRIAGNIFLAVAVLAGILEFYARKADAKAKDLGKVIYNLTVEIQCHKRTFDKTLLYSAEDEIEMYGLAIYRAKRYLKGNWKVTEKGYLVRGFAQGVENRTAEIDIDDVTPGLAVLAKVLTGEEQMKDNSCRVHLHFKDGGGVMNVGANDNGLYLN
jgi:hypothetical protein